MATCNLDSFAQQAYQNAMKPGQMKPGQIIGGALGSASLGGWATTTTTTGTDNLWYSNGTAAQQIWYDEAQQMPQWGTIDFGRGFQKEKSNRFIDNLRCEIDDWSNKILEGF